MSHLEKGRESLQFSPMSREIYCLPPTNKKHGGEWSVSRGSTQAKCYDCLGKYVIRQTGINTITSLLVRNTDFQTISKHILLVLKLKPKSARARTVSGEEVEWHWHEIILETIIKKHQPNSHHRKLHHFKSFTFLRDSDFTCWGINSKHNIIEVLLVNTPYDYN